MNHVTDLIIIIPAVKDPPGRGDVSGFLIVGAMEHLWAYFQEEPEKKPVWEAGSRNEQEVVFICLPEVILDDRLKAFLKDYRFDWENKLEVAIDVCCKGRRKPHKDTGVELLAI